MPFHLICHYLCYSNFDPIHTLLRITRRKKLNKILGGPGKNNRWEDLKFWGDLETWMIPWFLKIFSWKLGLKKVLVESLCLRIVCDWNNVFCILFNKFSNSGTACKPWLLKFESLNFSGYNFGPNSDFSKLFLSLNSFTRLILQSFFILHILINNYLADSGGLKNFTGYSKRIFGRNLIGHSKEIRPIHIFVMFFNACVSQHLLIERWL